MLQTRDIAKSHSGTQLNWTTAQAGTVRNQIPEKAGRRRRHPRHRARRRCRSCRPRLNEKVKDKLVPDTETTVKIEVGRPAFVASDRGRALAKEGQGDLLPRSSRTLDIVEMTGGATDAGFANRSGKAIVVESFGLAGFGYPRPRRIYRHRLDRAAALSDDAAADGAGEAEIAISRPRPTPDGP